MTEDTTQTVATSEDGGERGEENEIPHRNPSVGGPQPDSAGKEAPDSAPTPAGADPRRLYTDPEFDDDESEREEPFETDTTGDIP